MIFPSIKTALIAAVIVALGAFVLLRIGGVVAQSGCTQPISADGDYSGSWTSGCLSENTPTEPTSPPPGTRYARFYTFTLSAPANIAIDLTSDTDTYMYLMEGTGTNGTVLHENDDAESGNTNSHISETLSVGDYTIEATTYELSTSGNFTLTVSGIPAVPTPTTVPGAPTPTTEPATTEPTPTVTVTPTQQSMPTDVLSRLTALETAVAVQKGLLSTLDAKITALDSRIATLEADASSPTPTPTPEPTATPVPTPEPTPLPSVGTNIGDIAPRFTLPSVRSGNYTLVSFRGEKNVVLVFYRAYWDPFCRAQIVELTDHYTAIEQQDAILLAVSADNLQGAETAAYEWKAPFSILYNSDKSVITDYGVLADNNIATPSTFVIDKEGVIRWKYIGTTGDRPSPETILQQLQALEN